MNAEALRDHAEQILRAVAKDMMTPQTSEEQSQKAKGRAPRIAGAPETAAETHAFLRAKSGAGPSPTEYLEFPTSSRVRAVDHLRFTPQFIKLLDEIVIGE
jgi:hypothetical protein